MYTWINKNHLKEALNAANKTKSLFSGYVWHWLLAMQEAMFLLLIFVGSVIHAFFPWVLDFKLLEWRIARLKKLKEKLPNDPQLKKVSFDE
jgi:hypothetical protein